MQYKAPEMFRPKSKGGSKYAKPADVYSFAILCWEVFSGKVPYAGVPDHEVTAKHMGVFFGEDPERPSLEGLPTELLSVIERCWTQESEDRPTFEEGRDMLCQISFHEMINSPGFWDVFIGHSRRCADAVVLATEVATSFEKMGMTVWLDVRMHDRSTAAMEEGVRKSKHFVAVVSGPCVNNDRPQDPAKDNAYFRRAFCVMELNCAVENGKHIQPILRIEDKARIGEFLDLLDEPLRMNGGLQDVSHLRSLGATDWIDLNRNDNEYWDLGMTKLVRALKKGEEKKANKLPSSHDA